MRRTSSCAIAVHPRSRGEHSARAVSPLYLNGSSPLARGTHGSSSRSCGGSRFIPARAGNTEPRMLSAVLRAVHPRSRGEHPWRNAYRRAFTGSSPLARGTLFCDGMGLVAGRFIPARAGNTWAAGSAGWPRAVHPRSRGEHSKHDSSAAILAGSSPLARGTPRCRAAPAPLKRFIPARAGNTASARGSFSRSPVHPRSRGEHTAFLRAGGSRSGSSPLARGTQSAGLVCVKSGRFIPARAGNTLVQFFIVFFLPVHPRSRGEHVVLMGHPDFVHGSSPLARGTHFL